MLLSCGVFVCLSGIMFDSPFLNDGNTPLRGMVLAYTSIIVIVFSILYFIAAFLYEIKISRLRKKTKRAVMWSKVKGFKGKLINQQRQIKSSQPPWKTKKQKFSLEGLTKVAPVATTQQGTGETQGDIRANEYGKFLTMMEAEVSDDGVSLSASTSSGIDASSSNASSTSSGDSASLSNSTSSHLISSSESAGNDDNVSDESVEDGQSRSSDVEYVSNDSAMEGASEASFALPSSNRPETGPPNANGSGHSATRNTDERGVVEKSDGSDAREMLLVSSDDRVGASISSDSTDSSNSSSSNTSETEHSRRSDKGKVVKKREVELSDDSSHARVSTDEDMRKGVIEAANLHRNGDNADDSHFKFHGVRKLEKPLLSSNTSSSDEFSSDDSSSN